MNINAKCADNYSCLSPITIIVQSHFKISGHSNGIAITNMDKAIMKMIGVKVQTI